MKINLGCGRKPIKGYINIDKHRWPGVDVICDIDREPIPTDDRTVDEVRADHSLEHFQNLHNAMREIHRVLKVGGLLYVRVPYGLRSLYDPYHVRPFDENTLLYFCNGMPDDTCCQIENPRQAWFHMEILRVNRGFYWGHGIPGRWHISKYIPRLSRLVDGDSRDMDLHVGFKREIVAILRKLP